MMSIYFFGEVIMFFLALLVNYLSLSKNKMFFKIICFFWAFLFGLRAYCVGNDTQEYADFFMGSKSFYGQIDDNPELEIGFLVFLKVLRQLTTYPTILFSILSTWLFYLVYKIYLKVGRYDSYCYSLLIFFVISNCFMTLMCATRQCLSFCVLLSGLYICINSKSLLDKKKKKKKILLGCLIMFSAILFHKSIAFLLLILGIAYYMHFSKKIMYIMIVSSFVLSYFFLSYIGDLFNQVFVFAGSTAFNGIDADVMTRYSDDFGTFNQNFITLLAWSIPPLLTIYLSDNDYVDNFYFRIMILSVCIFLLFNTTYLIERINTLLILLGFTKYLPYNKYKNINKYKLIYVLFALIMLVKAGIRYDNWPITDSTVPYYFIWEK